MVVAENDVLNNECTPNSGVLRIFSQHSIICGIHINTSVNVKVMSLSYIAIQEAEYSLGSVVRTHHILLPYLDEHSSLRTDSENAHDSYHTVLFGYKRCEMVGHILRINCSVMIAFFL